MNHKYLPAAILVLFIALPFLGCSKSKESDQKTESTEASKDDKVEPFEVNACSLMTRQEAEELLDEKLQPPREEQHLEGESTRAAMSFCLFPSESEKSMTIFYRKSPIADNTPESIQAAKNTVSSEGASVQDVNGVGNSAFWSGSQLHVFQGDRSYLIITVDGFADEKETREKSKKAAEIAIERV